MPTKNIFFDLKQLKENPSEDGVMEEFNKLNQTVEKLTEGRGKIHLAPMTDDEAVAYFRKYKQDLSYYAYFRYVLYDPNGKKYLFRNRFACLTYSDTFPVWIIDLKDANQKTRRFIDASGFHDYVKAIVNKKSFIRSLQRAMNGKINMEDEDDD